MQVEAEAMGLCGEGEDGGEMGRGGGGRGHGIEPLGSSVRVKRGTLEGKLKEMKWAAKGLSSPERGLGVGW